LTAFSVGVRIPAAVSFLLVLLQNFLCHTVKEIYQNINQFIERKDKSATYIGEIVRIMVVLGVNFVT